MLEDQSLAERYGWTLREIDALTDADRERIRGWHATRAIYSEAERFVQNWMRKNAGVVSMVERMRGARR